ncbi:Cysteine desulfuration protein SufE [Chlamydiales bacterium SCGC AG-110-P3]|nr:Cysteine desulfuration protein SufE [Chlamydiales bacterium SCGC AG-110-P3]
MTSFKDKIQLVKSRFSDCDNAEYRYMRIIELGRDLPPLDPKDCVEFNRVVGCQSRMYLHSDCVNGLMIFSAQSDALISAGLAALLVAVYSGESPETVLKEAPTYLSELGVSDSISPNRANGLHSLHLRMKQEALKSLVAAG